MPAQVAKSQALGQGGVTQCSVEHTAVGEHADMAVGQGFQLLAAVCQVIRGAPLGDHQRQHLAQGEASFGLVRCRRGIGEQGVGVVEIAAEPHAQAIGQTVHFAMSGGGGERHAIKVVAHDILTRGQGLWPLLVGADAGGDHLQQFVPGRQGQAMRRVPVLFQLCGQGTAAGGLFLRREILAHL